MLGHRAPLRYFGMFMAVAIVAMVVAMVVAPYAFTPADQSGRIAQAQDPPTPTPTPTNVPAPPVDICDRTQEIQDFVLEIAKRVVPSVTCSTLGIDTFALSNISAINLQNMGIRSFKEGDFDDFTQLTEIRLDGNLLTELPNDFWDGSARITTLTLANNLFTELGDDFFDKEDGSRYGNRGRISTFDISGNRLESIGEDVFDGFNRLSFLDLSNNKLTTLPEGVFDTLDAVTSIDLRNNQLESLPDRVFHGLRTIPEDCVPSPPPKQRVNERVLEVNLQHNNLTAIPDELFDCLEDLRTIDLSYNNIAALPDNIFDFNPDLISVNLESNNLTTLPEDLVKENDKLETLNLNDNQLTSIEGIGLVSQRGIVDLLVRNNQLTQLPEDYVTAIINRGSASNGFCLINLAIGDNPFSEEWIKSGRLNDLLKKFGEYNPRGITECSIATRYPPIESPFFRGNNAMTEQASFDAITKRNLTGVRGLDVAGINLSHTVTGTGRTAWRLLLSEFAKTDFSFTELTELAIGWEGLEINNTTLENLPYVVERLVVKDATFTNDISRGFNRGFHRFEGQSVREEYNRIDGTTKKTGIQNPDGFTTRHDATYYWARLPSDEFTGHIHWYDDRTQGLQSLTLDNVGLTGDGTAILGKLPTDSLRWLEIRNNPGLTKLGTDISSMNNLFGLHLEGNGGDDGIATINEDAFTGGTNKLQYLGLVDNGTSHIVSGAFNGLDNLESLVVKGNDTLGSLESMTLLGLKELKHLDMRNNDLVSLPTAFFSHIDRSRMDGGMVTESSTRLQQIHLDDNPGAPFQIDVGVIDSPVESTDGDQVIAVREGAPYTFQTDILNMDGTFGFTKTVPEGTVTGTDAFDFAEGSTLGFLENHPHPSTAANFDCFGVGACYSGFEFAVDPPIRLITVKLGPDSPVQLYGVGDMITFVARYTEDVNVGGSPVLMFTIGGTEERGARFTGKVGENGLSFEYTVEIRDEGLTGLDTSRSTIQGGRITGSGNRDAVNMVHDTSLMSIDGIAFTAAGAGGPVDPGDGTVVTTAEITRIEPSIRSVNLRGGEEVRIGITAYGLQDLPDNGLLDGVTITWEDNNAGGDIDGTGDIVVYTAPSVPGVFTITSSVGPRDCIENEDTEELECTATVRINVRRPSAPQPEETPPVNPSGNIPLILTDNRGNNYEVFTPVDGGSFDPGEGFRITAKAGDVPNGEVIGVRMTEGGPASNLGMTHQRYTLGGNMYEIHVVDSAGASVDAYVLDQPAEVCVPLPASLRSNISSLALIALNSDDTQTILAARVRIGGAGESVCGNVSSLPSTVAVGSQGAPAAIPTPVPTPEPTTPDTGATAPSSQATLWLLLLGITTATLAVGVLFTARRRKQHN